jgi:hypothetical protein
VQLRQCTHPFKTALLIRLHHFNSIWYVHRSFVEVCMMPCSASAWWRSQVQASFVSSFRPSVTKHQFHLNTSSPFVTIYLLQTMSQPAMRLVFLPLKPARHHTPAAFFQQCRAKSTSTPPLARSTAVTRRSHPQLFPHEHLALQSRNSRPFSTNLSCRATVVKQNPRADDDGKDMTIEISETAAKVRLHPGPHKSFNH